MEFITEWVKDIFILIISVTFIEILLPEGKLNKYVKFIFSIIILAAILDPVRYFSHK